MILETYVLNTFLGEVGVYQLTLNATIALISSAFLLVISGLISASEVAFFSLTPADLSQIEESENAKDKLIARNLQQPQNLLATILIANNFVNVAIILLLTLFTNSILNFENAQLLGFIFQIVVITFLLLLFGEIVPKIYASRNGQKISRFTVSFLNLLAVMFKPLVKLLVNSTSFVNNRLSKHNRTNISMDELSQALELTTNNKDEDKEILEGIIKFGNIQVVDIMTSRVDMVDVDIKTNFKQLMKLIIDCGYSRIPVFLGTRDNIKGVLYSKDLLPHLDKPDNFRWQSLMRQPYYVPETKKIDDLLREFQKNRVHLAIVVDEYGGTSGLVTLEDIVEEIVGDISDEYDEDEKMFTKIDNHTFVFEAKIQLNDFFKIEEIEESDFSKISEEVETLAGLVLEIKGEIPTKNERIVYDKYVFEILAVDNRRIKKIKLHINKPDEIDE